MSAFKGLLRAPRPWHVLLAPALPLLGLFANNSAISPPGVLVWPVLVSSALALILWLAVLLVARDRDRGALAASVLVLAVMSFGTLGALAEYTGVWLTPVFYLVVFAVCVKLIRAPSPGAAATIHVNRAFALAALFLVAPIGLNAAASKTVSVEPFRMSTAAKTDKPDVYVLVLDGYAREDVLREHYGYATTLVPELRKLGFAVADDAIANYAQTSLAMSSALNGDYLPQLGLGGGRAAVRRDALVDLIARNRFFQAFKDAGYFVRAYGSEYSMMRPAPADDRPAPLGVLDEFSYAAVEATAIPAAVRALGFRRGGLTAMLHRHHLEWTIEDLATNALDESRPALVFAHLIAPHPPFVFDGGGVQRPMEMPALLHDGTHWDEISDGTGESYARGYVNKVRYLNGHIVSAVSSILARRRRPAIVLIHSDHGPGDRLEWENPDRTDMHERMSILLALRFPNGETPLMRAHASPVNAYRAVLNRALGASLPQLENRAFFSTWSKPFGYMEVTERVACEDCG